MQPTDYSTLHEHKEAYQSFYPTFDDGDNDDKRHLEKDFRRDRRKKKTLRKENKTGFKGRTSRHPINLKKALKEGSNDRHEEQP